MTFTKIGEALDKISVLGTDYTVHFIPEGEETRLKDCDGFCDETTKEIVVENYKRGEMGSKGNLELQEQKNLRHEIIHVVIDIESPQIYEIVHQSKTDECDPFIMIESLLHLLLLKQLFTIDYL